jgi:hypothetical protein
MAKHRRIPGNLPEPRDAVQDNLGGAYWSVDEGNWSAVEPGLPDDLVDLVAPPIIVGIAPVPTVSPPSADTPALDTPALDRPALDRPAVAPLRVAAPRVAAPRVATPVVARPVAATPTPAATSPPPPPLPRSAGRHRRSTPAG